MTLIVTLTSVVVIRHLRPILLDQIPEFPFGVTQCIDFHGLLYLYLFHNPLCDTVTPLEFVTGIPMFP